MSVREIIDELPKLPPQEFLLVQEKMRETEVLRPRSSWGKSLMELSGTAGDLPADLSRNHDHYLYGTPKRG